MLYLLDTHAVLWLMAGDERARGVAAVLSKPRATVLLSAVSLWEIAIKKALGKLEAPADLPEQLERFAFEPLPVTGEHAWAVGSLEPHHADPFDRLLAAQALTEDATLVSRDTSFDAYGVRRQW
ncbi:MAG: type II toxin-antitoxin system VapC family toxin [Solirubrobacteraceae bacterium]|nr:type II toxin-antitoxin system VapC family toxin [Solirubrobacteraceae bacterium]